MRKGVLILGGYGNFGKYIAEHLIRENIPITISGRNQSNLQSTSESLSKISKHQIPTIHLDILDKQKTLLTLKENPHKLVINTCGPFQNSDFSVVNACIETGTHYIDLADGRNFVKGVQKYHENAYKEGVTVITGASSVPGLSSAVLEKYYGEFEKIEEMIYGINPGQKTNRGGLATAKGVMGYVGKPIPLIGYEKPAYGWQGLHIENFPELGTRMFSNCEVPDLDIFPKKYGIKSVRFMAGTENKVLHMAIMTVSWLVRLGLPIDLPKHAERLLNLSHTIFDHFGTDEGGMFVILRGLNKEGKRLEIKWYIIVKKGHGPNVPIIPSIYLAKKIMKENYELPGVHVCAGLISLEDYIEGLKEFQPSVYESKQLI